LTGGIKMTSDQLKTEFIREIVRKCSAWASREQLASLESSMTIALNGLELSKLETALSTDVETPNEWYVKQFFAVKMVKGLSEKSLKYYLQTVKAFLREVERPIPKVTANDIRYYLAVRETRDHVSKTTLGNELRNLRSFFSTLFVEEIIPKNPTARIDAVKTEKKVKKPFTEMEVEQLRAACVNRKGLNKKHLAIVEFLYSTGCRVGELVLVKRSDIEGDRVLVHGKGSKDRYVYLNPRAIMALQSYLETRHDDCQYVFVGEKCCDPNWIGTKPMSTSSVEAIIRTLGKRAKLDNCHPHRFRRTAATLALKRGMPIEQVSKMLGHEQISTTQIYAITEEADLYAAHKKYMN